MDLVTSLPAFVIAVVLISASPGPAMALIVRRAALRGYRAAVPTVLGLELGIYMWALAAAAGFAALAAGVGRASSWFSRTKVRRRFEIISGSVLVGLGLRVATTQR